MRQQELCDEGQLPDRLENPCEYQQLSQNENNACTNNSHSSPFYVDYFGVSQDVLRNFGCTRVQVKRMSSTELLASLYLCN